MSELPGVFETRDRLVQAAPYLIGRFACSDDQAQERIRQEAMAKRATLAQVARAIVSGKAVDHDPAASSRDAR